jgi:FAD binding domain
VIAGHFDRRIIAYPFACGDGKSKPLINWLCQMTVANDTPVREIWNRRVTQEHVLRLFGGWRAPWLDLPALIRGTPEIYEFPLVDRDPVQAWTFGRVTLVGDAAHPMQPTGAQAGSQALIDARVLTAALLDASDPVKALCRYDRERRPQTSVYAWPRRRGRDQVAATKKSAEAKSVAPTQASSVNNNNSSNSIDTGKLDYCIAQSGARSDARGARIKRWRVDFFDCVVDFLTASSAARSWGRHTRRKPDY